MRTGGAIGWELAEDQLRRGDDFGMAFTRCQFKKV